MTSTDAAAPHRTRARRLGRSVAYAAVVAVVFFGTGFLLRSKWDPLINADDAAIRALVPITRDHPRLLDFWLFWQGAFLPRTLYLIGTALAVWLWLGKGMRTRAWWAFGTMMFAWFVEFAGKYVFQRARPVVEDPVSKAPGYSFPSGHALGSAAFFTTLVILLWPVVRGRGRRAVMVTVAAVCVIVTALDRVFLGVHYPSDVTVGVITGVGLVLGSYAGYARWNPRDPDPAHDPDVDPRPDDTDVAGDRSLSPQES
ncbi:phosphatase PAP2 family protein [Phycicoccus sp.]|uniref:phosphatase PAP2 family protein n=1 Tax=Phycicoccus sp. TaxID=1902410 RepID=UPI002C0CE3F2|nr:phosphatase PAP2 family protein [Phycicoccus sp.]HMM94226.1 phosphatase PAP2 family protein [Phycicoccus sp.]